ncbi:P-loop containing nucleoside triphosphate hydrolase protein, partial [Dacryopinax primogenitus]
MPEHQPVAWDKHSTQKMTYTPKIITANGVINGPTTPLNRTPSRASGSETQGSRQNKSRSPNGSINNKTQHASPNLGQRRSRTAYMQSDEEDELSSQPNSQSPKKERKMNGAALPNGGKDELKRSKEEDIRSHRMQLPIYDGKGAIVNAVRENDTVVVLGETGSGKTTQLPQYLFDEGLAKDGMIAITQPRRVAAVTIAARVSVEQGTSLGEQVGYSVRFQERTSRFTKIKFCTDGMLVRELLLDPYLEKYSIVIIDEAHERTLRTDMLLGSLKRIQQERKAGERRSKDGKKLDQLKVVIMSATMDAERFSKFFGGCPILYVSGRQHPVAIMHAEEPVEDFIFGCKRVFLQILTNEPPGDILMFLPGQDDIESMMKTTRDMITQLPPNLAKVLSLPLYGALPPEQQRKIFDPAPEGFRKVVFATNIAETSITIPGIRYVVDTGLCKERSYHTGHGGSGLDELLIKPISKSSARQRAGRAGRLGAGTCFRLYTADTYEALPEAPIPEIQRCDLNAAILDLKVLGEDPLTFDYIDRPLDDAIRASLMTLYALQALNAQGHLTPLGRKMSSFPLEPSLSLVVISSKARACTSEILDIVSLLTCTAKLFVDTGDTREVAADARKKFRHRDGDHLTLLNVFRSYEDVVSANTSTGTNINADARTANVKTNGPSTYAGNRRAVRQWCFTHFLNEKALNEALTIRTQLRNNCEREGIDWKVSCGDDLEPVLKCLLDGLFRKSALKAADGTYRQIGMQQVLKIHPSSSLVDRKPAAIIFDELLVTTAVYARGVSVIHSSWLVDTPLFNSKKDEPVTHANGQKGAIRKNNHANGTNGNTI